MLREISLLLAYEVTRDLPLDDVAIETPLEPMLAPRSSARSSCFVSILRAGNGILDGMLDLVPSARVGHIGLYRDPVTLLPVRVLRRSCRMTCMSGCASWSIRCSPPAIPPAPRSRD